MMKQLAHRRLTDYQAFLSETGVTQEQMDAAALMLPNPVIVEGDSIHRVLPSSIEGLGVFSGGDFMADAHICTLMVGSEWTTCGRYINHDADPNSTAVTDQDGLVAIALRLINEGDEITLNYRQVRDAFALVVPIA